MARSKRIVGISLTGGLGNQIFQLAAALYVAKASKIFVFSGYGKPRLSKYGEAEIFSLLEDRDWFQKCGRKGNWLAEKSLGYILRMGVSPKRWEKTIVKRALTLIANAVMSIDLRMRIKICAGDGVGYFHIRPVNGNTVLAGYFQSYQWISDDKVYEKLFSIKPRGSNPEYESLTILAKECSPLIIHIRLGDYLNEELFGIPSADYYKKAISKMSHIARFDEIWLFSDSVEKAKEMFGSNLPKNVRWFGEVDGSTASTFQSMRLGSAYIIGNSTFSWWAAYLSFNREAQVIAPKPWFLGMEDPADLIPKNWTTIDAGYQRGYS